MRYYTEKTHEIYIRALFLYKNGVSCPEKELGIRYLMDISRNMTDPECIAFNKSLLTLAEEFQGNEISGCTKEQIMHDAANRIMFSDDSAAEDILHCLQCDSILHSEMRRPLAIAGVHKKARLSDTHLRIRMLANSISPLFDQQQILMEAYERRAESYTALVYLHEYFYPENREHYADLDLKVFARSLLKYYSRDRFKELLEACENCRPEVRREIFDYLKEREIRRTSMRREHSVRMENALEELKRKISTGGCYE